MNFLVFLLLLVTNSAHGLNSTFVFSGDIECSRENFQYRLLVKERDLMFDDDLNRPYKEYSRAPHHYSVFAQEDGDGIGQHYYEIFFKIRHNCDDRNEIRIKIVEVGEFPIIDGLTKNVTNINLDGAGYLARDGPWI